MRGVIPDIETLLQPFREQPAPVRSIVALACHRKLGLSQTDFPAEGPIGAAPEAALLRLVPDGDPAIVAPGSSWTVIRGGEAAYALDDLAQQARLLSGPSSGEDLLVLSAEELNLKITPANAAFSFRAVAVLLFHEIGSLGGEASWRLRRSLFDRGLVCIGSVHVAGSKALCFLASDAVQSVNHLDIESRGHVAMSVLREGAGFGNQLFRYSCAKLYALRHGLTAAFPDWKGKQLFGLNDKSHVGLALRKLSYPGFADNDREFWEMDDPPINIDLEGYFQEIPACWQRQRPLLRRLFQLPSEQSQAIDAWRHEVTEGGQRTLVAIHVRRGDYRQFQNDDSPWFRLVPEDWYLDWLRTIWPTLRQPLLYVATDEPDTIQPVFGELEPISASFGPMARALPEHVRDFEVMRRADYLALCNSSFSRMAAILAPSTQRCFLPSFETQSFEPYQPWIDLAFWARFRNSPRAADLQRKRRVLRPAALRTRTVSQTPAEQAATIYFDVSDLVRYLLHHTTLSGIQRVQCEILEHLLHTPGPQPIRLVVLNERGGLGAVAGSALLDAIKDFRTGATSQPVIESELRALVLRAAPCAIRPRDTFLTIGAFWAVSGMGLLLQQLKNSGATIGVFIHDIIPIVAPEYFQAREARVFAKTVMEALTFADFLLTTSEYNQATLAGYMASRKMDPLPVHVVPLAHTFSPLAPIESKISSAVASITETDYVLCVGTIEVRKNPTYLFNIWNMMVRSGRQDIPNLVFAGRKGWFVQDFLDQLRSCQYLGDKIVVLHDVTDVELDVLYRSCILTVFPSFVEGWGLPVGESLAHGKICLCSATGGIPAVAGELGDYIDPYNARDGLDRLLKYLDDPKLRLSREREIASRFEPRSWRKVTDDFLQSAQALASLVRPLEGVVAITLPQNEFVPTTSAIAMDGILSGELVCVSGWGRPETSGVRARQPEATVRFRADAQVGTRINLLVRLAAVGRDFSIRVRSGSGAQTEAFLVSGSEKMAVLSCEVEPGNLITAHLSLLGGIARGGMPPGERLLGPRLDGDDVAAQSYWMLKGVLYFDPKRAAAEALKQSKVQSKEGPLAAPQAPPPIRSEQLVQLERVSRPDGILLTPISNIPQAVSFGGFLQAADCYWPLESIADRDAPIFADHADRRAFYSGCGKGEHAPQVGRIKESIRLVRRSGQFVSASRFSEGSVFDRSGVSRAFGYLRNSPPEYAPWLLHDADSLWIREETLARAPYYEHSYLIFYNGNLHNYYHWMAEGLLCLDVLTRALGPRSGLRIALPKSVDVAARLDHRESLQALGFGEHDIVEVAEGLIQVREAIWVDSDLVQYMPTSHLKDFQRRIASLYGNLRGPRNRRLLVARSTPTRKIHNLEQVQAFLSRYDFETVYLEGMSTRDQILLFQSAEFIIGPHGAGLANLLFCEPGTKVIELSPIAEFRPFFWMISQKLDLVHGLQFCPIVPNGEFQGFQSPFVVDIDKLQALMLMVDAHY